MNERVKKWWTEKDGEQRQKIILMTVCCVVGVVLLFHIGRIITGATSDSSRSVEEILSNDRVAAEEYAFGGGRSNVAGLQDLQTQVDAIRSQVEGGLASMEAEKRALVAERERFQEWVQTTPLENQARDAQRSMRQLDRKIADLEGMIEEMEQQTTGIVPYPRRADGSESSDQAPAPAVVDAQSSTREPVTSPQPEPDASNDDLVLDNELFGAVGPTTPRQDSGSGQADPQMPQAAPASPAPQEQEQEPPAQPRTIYVNGRSLAGIQDEDRRRAEAQEQEAADLELQERPDDPRPPEQREQGRVNTVDNSLGPGTIISGVLLHGMDAPTGSAAQSRPVPVLIRVKDLAILPSNYRADISECFILGAAYGSMSEERAFIRTETLSCVSDSGEWIRAQVGSYGVGPDGGVGIRGPIEQRNGALMARSVMAGMFSGFGSAIGGRRTGSFVIGQDRASGQDILEEGFGRGAGTALERVADYYLAQAEAIYPVITVQSLTPVDLVVLDSVEFEL